MPISNFLSFAPSVEETPLRISKKLKSSSVMEEMTGRDDMDGLTEAEAEEVNGGGLLSGASRENSLA